MQLHAFFFCHWDEILLFSSLLNLPIIIAFACIASS